MMAEAQRISASAAGARPVPGDPLAQSPSPEEIREQYLAVVSGEAAPQHADAEEHDVSPADTHAGEASESDTPEPDEEARELERLERAHRVLHEALQ